MCKRQLEKRAALGLARSKFLERWINQYNQCVAIRLTRSETPKKGQSIWTMKVCSHRILIPCRDLKIMHRKKAAFPFSVHRKKHRLMIHFPKASPLAS